MKTFLRVIITVWLISLATVGGFFSTARHQAHPA